MTMDLFIEQPAALHWLWGAMVAAVLIVLAIRGRARGLRRFAESPLMKRLTPELSVLRRWVRAVLLMLAMLLLVAAMLDVRWGRRVVQLPQRGIDVIVVLDVSRSMLAEDVRPNRLVRAKQMVSDMMEGMGGDRVGIVTFAGSAVLSCPLTGDFGAVRMILEEIDTLSSERGGSLLGDAVRLASESFTDEIKDHKAIVVISDGEDHDSFPVEAARQAFEERGIRAYTVGIGDAEEGARIPIVQNGLGQYLTYDGEEVWSKMNPEILRSMALAAGGAYVPAGTSLVDLGEVFGSHIEAIERQAFGEGRIEIRTARYQWFAALALAALLLETWLTDVKRGSRLRAMREGVV
jgi:Ca-activated chloride channel family protein